MEFFEGTAPTFVGWRCAQYDGIVALGGLRAFRAQPGVSSMMVVLLIGGIGLLLAGLLTIGLGIQIRTSSFGNTLILVGYGRGLHRGDHARPLGSRSGTEENRIGGLARVSGARTTAAQAPRAIRPRKTAVSIQPRPAVRGRRRPCRVAGAVHRRRGGRRPRARDRGPSAPEPVGGRASRQAAAQSAVFLIIAERARACPGANQRSFRGRSLVQSCVPNRAQLPPPIVRRCLAKTGTS